LGGGAPLPGGGSACGRGAAGEGLWAGEAPAPDGFVVSLEPGKATIVTVSLMTKCQARDRLTVVKVTTCRQSATFLASS